MCDGGAIKADHVWVTLTHMIQNLVRDGGIGEEEVEKKGGSVCVCV